VGKVEYKIYISEAVKITLFCLIVTALMALIGADQKAILVIFNIAVMSCAVTFSPEKKHLVRVFEGGIVTTLSIIAGGVLGFYIPNIAQVLIIVYAALAFLLPRNKERTILYVNAALMFLLFTSFPFDIKKAFEYLLYSIPLILVLVIHYRLFDRIIYARSAKPNPNNWEQKEISALTAVLALVCALGVSYLLKKYTNLQHLYWIGLTVLVVIQGSREHTIKTSIKRIIVNTAGAFIIVLLMRYVVPAGFLINLLMLTFFLFMIFAIGFSYVWRVLFIELFVLGFTHLLGQYSNVIAVDRAVLTLIGGLLVIGSTILSYKVFVRSLKT